MCKDFENKIYILTFIGQRKSKFAILQGYGMDLNNEKNPQKGYNLHEINTVYNNIIGI